MARAEHIKARKDYPNEGIKKGDMYYKWGFRFGGTYRSKTAPIRQQLTQSEFLIGLYDFEDRQNALEVNESLPDEIESLVSDIQAFADEQEDKRSNMPDGLQDSETGQLLEERAEGLREWADELDNVDRVVDNEELLTDAYYETEVIMGTKEWCPSDEEFKRKVDQHYESVLNEKLAEILEEVQNISHSL